MYVMGDHSIFKLAQDAKNKTEEAIQNEQEAFNRTVNEIDDITGKDKRRR